MKNINYKKLLVIFVILCLSIIPCYALFTNPYFISTGHDNVFHFCIHLLYLLSESEI